jgi:ADP-heptose:LPS heptosyltransferase
MPYAGSSPFMKIDMAYSNWRQYLAGAPLVSPETVAAELSGAFMGQFAANREPDLRAIALLCEMAMTEENFQLRRTAVSSLYKNIVEPLCDDFSSRCVALCNLVLLAMIGFIRRQREGRTLHRLLNELGYGDEKLLLSRYAEIRRQPPIAVGLKKKISKILILSRVTIGADVAITSIMVHRLSRSFPRADLIVVGPAHLPEIFYGVPRTHWVRFHYQRDGGLIGRLTSYTSLYHLLQVEWEGIHDGTTLLFDPDSRLSQLGLLPLVNASRFYYFPSRDDQPQDTASLSQLTNRWLNHVLGEEDDLLPQIAIRPAHTANIKTFFAQFPPETRKIVINLGVGNDPRKRLADPFEEDLLAGLLRDSRALVVLDSGCHPGERDRARVLMEIMKGKGFQTAAVSEKNLTSKQIHFRSGLVCIQGGIGMLSALIDQADVFFGYDSCCQHLATARGTPSVICFAGAPNDRFFARWRPLDKSGSTTTIRVADTACLTGTALSELAEKFRGMILAE